MEFKLETVDKKYYKKIYEWRRDPYAMEHNPFAPCDFDLFIENLIQLRSRSHVPIYHQEEL